jgi:GR25 family glycosyltransferase involved in LPS biosynthesis/glycosyltransferase involved in cell wall biosynthesis
MTENPNPHLHIDQPAKRTCILVLGMHRSGTSAVTRVLSLMGAALPKNILGAGHGNETGHWEPERLIAYHDQLLSELGSAWHDWSPLDFTKLTPERRQQIKHGIAAIIQDEYLDADLIVLKDPRISRFASFFIETLADNHIEPTAIMVLRNPLDVINSLIARDTNWLKDYDRLDAALLWLAHMLESERAARTLPHAILSYEVLLGNPVEAIKTALNSANLATRLSASNKISSDNTSGDKTPEIAAFIDGKHRHHAQNPQDLGLDPVTAGWVAEAYGALKDLEHQTNVEAARNILDRVYCEFQAAMPVLKASAGQRKAAFAATRLAKEETLEAKSAARLKLEKAKTQLTKIKQSTDAALSSAKNEAERLRGDVEAGQAARDEARREIETLRSVLEQTEKARQIEIAEADLKFRAVSAELIVAKTKLDVLVSLGLKNSEKTTHLERELQLLRQSRSWLITKPLRKAAALVRIARTSSTRELSSFIISNIKKINQFPYEFNDSNVLQNRETDIIWLKGALIVTPPHTIHYASILAAELEKLGFISTVELSLKNSLNYQHVFVFCPNVFEEIPDDYIAIQMEQTVSSRWITTEYIQKLSKARLIIDYSTENIDFFLSIGFPLRQLFYVPVPCGSDTTLGLIPLEFVPEQGRDVKQNAEECVDVLFYGDTNCERRERLLAQLSSEFRLKSINNIFGYKLWEELKRAKCVVNIHYYEGALLETTRLSECMSFGAPVISEDSADYDSCREFEKGVLFVPAGDRDALVNTVRRVLEDDALRQNLMKGTQLIASDRHHNFAKSFRRTLFAVDMIGIDDALEHFTLPEDAESLCLTLAETSARTRSFKQLNRNEFSSVNGLRHRVGWKGCALSYKAIMTKAVERGLDEILICEDDVSFPQEYDSRLSTVRKYLNIHKDKWDIFSGFMADIKPDFVIKKVEKFEGTQFIWLDRCISTVYNIYSNKAIKILSDWDYYDGNVETNTIDRYLERHKLSVVLVYPFLVNHDDKLTSTVWGFNNSQYNDMIKSTHAVVEKLLSNHSF